MSRSDREERVRDARAWTARQLMDHVEKSGGRIKRDDAERAVRESHEKGEQGRRERGESRED